MSFPRQLWMLIAALPAMLDAWLRRLAERLERRAGRIDNIPLDIIALMPQAYRRPPAWGRWVERYEAALADGLLPRPEYERIIYALLAIGDEPTLAIEAFRIVSEPYTGHRP